MGIPLKRKPTGKRGSSAKLSPAVQRLLGRIPYGPTSTAPGTPGARKALAALLRKKQTPNIS